MEPREAVDLLETFVADWTPPDGALRNGRFNLIDDAAVHHGLFPELQMVIDAFRTVEDPIFCSAKAARALPELSIQLSDNLKAMRKGFEHPENEAGERGTLNVRAYLQQELDAPHERSDLLLFVVRYFMTLSLFRDYHAALLLLITPQEEGEGEPPAAE